MKKILLICALGMSSSMICRKMRAALSPEEQDWIIEAKEQHDFNDIVGDYDVVLLSPQVRFLKEDFTRAASVFGVAVALIDARDYGMANGTNILQTARQALGEGTS